MSMIGISFDWSSLRNEYHEDLLRQILCLRPDLDTQKVRQEVDKKVKETGFTRSEVLELCRSWALSGKDMFWESTPPPKVIGRIG